MKFKQSPRRGAAILRFPPTGNAEDEFIPTLQRGESNATVNIDVTRFTTVWKVAFLNGLRKDTSLICGLRLRKKFQISWLSWKLQNWRRKTLCLWISTLASWIGPFWRKARSTRSLGWCRQLEEVLGSMLECPLLRWLSLSASWSTSENAAGWNAENLFIHFKGQVLRWLKFTVLIFSWIWTVFRTWKALFLHL